MMNRYLGILLFGLLGCSQQQDTSPDLGSTVNDLGSMSDLGMSNGSDLAMTSGGDLGGNNGGPPVTGTTLALVAGGLGGFGDVDDVGRAARFGTWVGGGPSGVASDGAGNLYLSDGNNSTIRMMVLATGAVTTLAGTPGALGYLDGTGAAAQFRQPRGLALDGAGNLYVADTANNRIRKIVIATGAVTTFAGSGASTDADGTGTAAAFAGPSNLLADGMGNLYVSDLTAIRKIVLSSAAVTTVAGSLTMTGSADGPGTTTARFNGPGGMALDGAGNLYVADSNNYTLRQIVLSSGMVSTLAGKAGAPGGSDGTGSAARFSGPSALVFDGTGNLYVTDSVLSIIRQVALSTAAVSTVAGTLGMLGSADGIGPAARFYSTVDAALDGSGNLYIADSKNYTLRKMVLATHAVSTVAGSAPASGSADGTGAAAQFWGPGAVSADGSGNLFVADTRNNTIRKIVLATGVVSTIAGTVGTAGSTDGSGTTALFSAPQGIATDGTGNVYVADTLNATIRKIVLANGAVTTIAGAAGMKGNVDAQGPSARFNQPTQMALDGAGNLYVGDNTIRKIVLATNDVSTIAGSYSGITGLAADGAGNLYFVKSGMVGKIVLSTGTVSTVLMSAQLSVPSGMAVDSAGYLFVSDGSLGLPGLIHKIEIATGNRTTFAGVSGRFGVKLGPLPGQLTIPVVGTISNGQLILTDKNENAILAVR